MTLTRQDLEDAVAKFDARVRSSDALMGELDGSLAEFFPTPEARPAALEAELGLLAARRHLEWFLFERPSDALGGVPTEVFVNQAPDEEPHAEALLGSLAGVFEVTSVEPDRGLWLRDLFGLGEYPVDEPEASRGVLPGDVAVGRLFPAGDTIFRLSPAVVIFRNGALLEALKRDAERLREGRRGSIRISQSELERMFHAPGGPVQEARDAAEALPDPAELETRLRKLLADGGADESFSDRLLAELDAAAEERRSGAITEALNRLAFDTEADLESARATLVEWWAARHAKAASTPAEGTAAGESDVPAPPDAVAEALARFDAARGEGRDLEQLFRTLESDLGLDVGGDGDQEIAPDFPGVVAAVVAEFLWETGREHGEATSRRYEILIPLGEFATTVGVIENLSASELLEFAGRWVLDRAILKDAEDARRLLDALEAFCRWSEESQDLKLWSEFERLHGGLSASLPRLVELRRRHEPAELNEGVVYRFERARDGRATLVDPGGDVHEVELQGALDGLLRNGDIVHAELGRRGQGELAAAARVGACYPPELLALAR